MAAAATGGQANYKWNQDVQFPPLRPLNEFILDKARYDYPSFKDLPRWNNRIVANLLYFQSNYFAFILGAILLLTFFYAKAMAIGLVTLMMVGLLAASIFANDPRLLAIRHEHPYAVIFVIIAVCYSFITCLPYVLTTIFSLALPILIVFLHASIRLRNINNKINQKFLEGVIHQTVMAKILRLLNLEPKAM